MTVIPTATIEQLDSMLKRLRALKLEIEGTTLPNGANGSDCDVVRDSLADAADAMDEVIYAMEDAKSTADEINEDDEAEDDVDDTDEED